MPQLLAAQVEQPDDEALALEGIAECLIAAGQTSEAEENLRGSLRIFQHLAMHQDAERLQMRIVALSADGKSDKNRGLPPLLRRQGDDKADSP